MRASHDGVQGRSLWPFFRLQIDHDIFPRLGATYQHIAVTWRLDRVEPIADGAGDECGFATVADAGTASPSHGDIACLGQFKDALK